MAIRLDIKSLVYKELNPMARAAGCKILVLDKDTYGSYSKDLAKKMQSFGIANDEWHQLKDAVDDYGCIAILKSNVYHGTKEIIPHFAKVGLDYESLHYLKSSNAERHPTWGDLDATIPPKKRMFLYWFAVSVEDSKGRSAFA